jgi:hypothetical protein
MEMIMNEKINSFVVNSVLTVLLVGILVLPAASGGLLGVQKGSQVLSAESSQQEHNFATEETSPSVSVQYVK